uniref:FLYWCH-type domain-containing protein n=1 Tax=Steinernema glaseri TaxID=37863 RepID=A0A1I7YF34_9BILA
MSTPTGTPKGAPKESMPRRKRTIRYRGFTYVKNVGEYWRCEEYSRHCQATGKMLDNFTPSEMEHNHAGKTVDSAFTGGGWFRVEKRLEPSFDLFVGLEVLSVKDVAQGPEEVVV